MKSIGYLFQGFQFHIKEAAENKVNVIVFGYHECESSRVITNHSHSHFELHFLSRGSFIYRNETGEIKIEEGDVCITRPGEAHEMAGVPNEPWNMYYAQIDKIEPPELRAIFDKTTTKKLTGCSSLIEDFSRIIEEAKNPGAVSEYLQLAMLYELIIKLGRQLSTNSPLCVSTSDKYSQLIEVATWYIENHCRHGLQIEEVAHNVGVSKSTLSHCFSDTLNETVCECNRRILMCRAKCLLEQSDMRISEIAAELGYPSIHYFSATFKARFNMPPREYREQYRANQRR